jgi:hypothetical protein
VDAAQEDAPATSHSEGPAPVATAAHSAGGSAGWRTHAADHDRWAWRRRVRSDPHRHRIYKIGVGITGSLLILLGLATGWLPGPGGIPLVLLGLAVLASEFEWAHRLLQRARHEVHVLGAWSRRQPRWVRTTGGAATGLAVLGAAWVGLMLVGLPGWTPDVLASFLGQLPGIR